ncbi:MAG: sodium:proton antiporter, partial [Planctomycetota bacterium]
MQSESHHASGKGPGAVTGIAVAISIYLVALVVGLPQKATALINAGHGGDHAASHGDEHAASDDHHSDAHDAEDHAHTSDSDDSHADGSHASAAGKSHGDSHHAGHDEPHAAPPVWTVTPFVLLLGAIAVLPLIPATEHWWESNRNRFIVAISLAAATLAYYGLIHSDPFSAHFPSHHTVVENADGFNVNFVTAILGGAILNEFIPFIVLLFSLYTISGGIRIEGDLQANPMTNALFMAAGGILASFIGTTGAAMLLIRPLLETNQARKHKVHTVLFFIFIVCNCGGCLLPIGDPPLFLGYLQGVDFFWTMGLWQEWMLCNGLLLLAYLLLDELWYYRQETATDITRDLRNFRALKVSGLAVNGPLLLGVVAAVAFLDPSKTVGGWHPWLYFREVVQLSLVAASLVLGSKAVREANGFNYHAIQEVAALFSGIFICMQPALQILEVNGEWLATNYINSPMHFYWITGGLSSVLDNAPTYLVFFQTA